MIVRLAANDNVIRTIHHFCMHQKMYVVMV